MNFLSHTSNENTQEAPQERRLTSVDAPLVRHYTNVVDHAMNGFGPSMATMYRPAIRIPLGDTVEQEPLPASQAPVEAPMLNQDFVSPAGAKQFENKMAETTHFVDPVTAADYNTHENAEAIRGALANLEASRKGVENA